MPIYEGEVMTMKSFLKFWAVFSALWMSAASLVIYRHYLPLFEQSSYIYNPLVNPNGLLDLTSENWDALQRSFPIEEYNIYSYGVPSKIEISFPKQSFTDGHLEVLIPVGLNLISASDHSPKWISFRNELTRIAFSLREKRSSEIYGKHLLEDAVMVFCMPSMLMLGFFASREFNKAGRKKRHSASMPNGLRKPLKIFDLRN
jgi:hypothetical protein